MKKLAIFMAALATMVGFTACEDDKEPVYKAPTKFVLNTPALQNQYVELTPEGTLTLYASQPDYGVSMLANYSAQVSLTEDFAEYEELTPTGTGHMAAMTFKQSDISLALCKLHGFVSEETYQDIPAEKVYFRALCNVNGIENSAITSNVVSFNQMKLYFAVAVPGYIYLVGGPAGWSGPAPGNVDHYNNFRLFEADDAIGSKIYSGVFDVAPDQSTFRFYTSMINWDTDSYGPGTDDGYDKVDDNGAYNVLFDWDGETDFTNQVVKTKNNFSFPNWPGGQMTIVVDMSNPEAMTVKMMAGSHTVVTAKYMYIVGSQAGWCPPALANADVLNNWRIADTDGSGIFTGTFDLPAQDKWYFRIYPELKDVEDPDEAWGKTPWSADAAGGNVDIALGTSYQAYEGEGCWVLPWPTDGQVTVTLDTNTNALTVNIPQ